MNMQTEEVLGSIHLWLTKRLKSATAVRNNSQKESPKNLILSGKAKAYVDMLSHLQCKWGKKLVHKPFPSRS